MGKIQVMDNELAIKIAAGEVIEQPVSVVKELVENALDAGADIISVEIAEGGKSQIKVQDNGEGMDRDDAKLALERHATSKIKHLQDLFNIKTLGFRGEALASIATVANVKITTRTADTIEGTMLEAEFGQLKVVRAIGCPIGTTIEVSNLFHNVPARKKYLKSIQQETAAIADIMTRYALINPEIAFKVVSDGKVMLSAPKTDSMLGKILVAYGRELAKEMMPVDYKQAAVSVKGYIAKPYSARQDRLYQSFYVNGRYVKSQLISKALEEAYGTLLFHHRYPIAVLEISVIPSSIDVNVHPAKEIVKFSEEEQVYNAVRESVSMALAKENISPEVSLKATDRKFTRKYELQHDTQVLLAEDSVIDESGLIRETNGNKVSGAFENSVFKAQAMLSGDTKRSIGPFYVLGQMNKTYILAEVTKGLLIVDQHAAQERLFYEKFMHAYKEKGVTPQKLISPVIIQVSPAEHTVLNENKSYLESIGFEIEDYGGNSLIVRSIPFVFERYNKDLMHDMIQELSKIDSKAVDEVKQARIARFACRKAIKAGDMLSRAEMDKLLKALGTAENPFSCPHGRPTMLNITIPELEKKFRRTG